MEPKYKSVFDLMRANDEARAYYEKLPDYVREQIGTRARSVNTYSGLRDYAENLLKGDG